LCITASKSRRSYAASRKSIFETKVPHIRAWETTLQAMCLGAMLGVGDGATRLSPTGKQEVERLAVFRANSFRIRLISKSHVPTSGIAAHTNRGRCRLFRVRKFPSIGPLIVPHCYSRTRSLSCWHQQTIASYSISCSQSGPVGTLVSRVGIGRTVCWAWQMDRRLLHERSREAPCRHVPRRPHPDRPCLMTACT
jgi:hypothetical protein